MSFAGPVDATQIDRSQPWHECSGQQLTWILQASLTWLESNHQAINELNVFPVPDGDSGTNMLLTMQSAVGEITKTPTNAAGEVIQAVAKGALMGARGNSGVILSQFWRGMANTLAGKETIRAQDFAASLQAGAKLAYQGVQKPVEGTILTVARDLSEAATRAAATSSDLHVILTAAVAEAQQSVARTPQLFPLLAKAGVVDAGAQGLFIILQGALKFVNGESLERHETGTLAADVTELQAEAGWGFDIQCIIRGSQLNVEEIRRRIESMGESVLVVGDSNMIKVHAHAPSPGAILDFCVSRGSVSRVIVENMQEQYQEILLGQSKPPIASESISGIATVVVASGNGLTRVFESLGASALVTGGATMNPSVQDILAAVEAAEAANIIILPNDKNIILAAQQAVRLTKKSARIVPSVTIPQGIAALLAFNFQADLESNADAMTRALKNVVTAEITRAVRTVSIDGLDVLVGQIIGLLNGVLCVAGSDDIKVAVEILRKMNVDKYEIVTVYFGQDVTHADAESLADAVHAEFSYLQTEVIDGGQPHMHYIISVE
jgi:DAK2 domain fusion protein YloV